MEGKIRLAVFGLKRLSREGGIEIVVKELCTRILLKCNKNCQNDIHNNCKVISCGSSVESLRKMQSVLPESEKLKYFPCRSIDYYNNRRYQHRLFIQTPKQAHVSAMNRAA